MSKSALLVIDVQRAMFDEADPVYEGEALLRTIGGLIAAARAEGAPVIYVRHGEGAGQPLEWGTEGWQIHPAIAPLDGERIIDKRTPDSFHETGLQAVLAELGVQHLVLTGIQTEVCVDTTCRRAYSLGYQVTLVKDAHSTWNSANLSAAQIIAHHNGVLRWFARVEEAGAVLF